MTRKIFCVAALIAVILTSSAVFSADKKDDNVFSDKTSGFSVTKPSEWVFLSTRVIEENRERVRLNDSELEKRIKEKAALPLVAFVKYPEPFENLNPSFQVVMSPLGELSEKSPSEILKLVVETLKKAFSEFTLIDEVKTIEISGLEAAGFKATYKVVTADGREFKTMSRMYLVTRGTIAFSITMSGTVSGADVAEEEFAKILSSVKISR